ncbi:MAG: TRAP transporter fused permease subunit [Rickettsiaceae bacterium H1]|nr:TRAP transporter fused permease subunit [Rickettsiaceae bacterium H1]
MKHEEIIDAEFGSRHPSKNIYRAICFIALFWSVFQLWVASPLQFSLGCDWLLFNNLEIRSIHLAIALFLAFLLFPIFKNKHITKIPFFDWAFSIIGLCISSYIYVFYDQIALRVGMPTQYDLAIAFLGIILLFEASRRVVGPTIAIVASIFLLYSYFGQHFPGLLAHRGNSLASIASHQWFSSEGVFGTALGVSADFVFLYVLFGSFLEMAGAGNFFIQLSFALLGRFTGGPAKAAVVASGLMGMMSGSSIANTITVGSFTIPLMKKMGLSPEKAGAIEVSAGINGQVMPPVMGAAAFIMSEYLGIPYPEIIKHAFLPAILIYVALLYTVHIEAKKIGIKPIKSQHDRSVFYSLLRGLIIMSSVFIVLGVVYFLINWIPGIYFALANTPNFIVVLGIFASYVLILKYQSQFPGLVEDNDEPILKLPNVTEILRSGIHFFIPVLILIWSLMINRLSPALSAYWSIMFLMVILITQNGIKSFFKNQSDKIITDIKQGIRDLISAMILGARNMVPIAIATATAGIIVGTVSLTGVGLRIGSIVDSVANGDVLITLILTAIISIVLGIGMPTTACYIIVSTLMVPVLEYAVHRNGILVPNIALHLFVFYFGLMADVTPPVGLASYAAAAVAKGNTLKTSTQAFLYNMRTMTLPFIFVFNPELLLYGITSKMEFIIILISSIIGIFMISASTQRYFLVKSKLYESALLLIVGISLLYPQGWINMFFSPFDQIKIDNIEKSLESHVDKLKIILINQNAATRNDKKVVLFRSLLKGNTIKDKLFDAGIGDLSLNKDNNLVIGQIELNSKAEKAEIDMNNIISNIEVSNLQPSKNLVFFPTLFILGTIILLQKRRMKLC